MPDQARADAQNAAERRHVTFHHQQVSFDGTTFVEAELDLADALDLDAAISARAESLAAAGCAESLDVRRALAAGDLARRQLALDLIAEPDDQQLGVAPRPRQVVLYVHLSEAAITGADAGIARVENHHRLVTVEQVRTWCANPDAQVVVKPVIDLAEHIHVEAYEVPDRLAEQTELRDLTCVFPWCSRPARSCEKDHVIAHARGGPTCSENIAPLCKRHHRLKTHAHGWTYTALEPGTYLWTSPHGYQFLRDHTGTTDVSNDRRRLPTTSPTAQHPADPRPRRGHRHAHDGWEADRATFAHVGAVAALRQDERVSPMIEPPNSVLLLVGREEFTPPATFAGASCAATADCIAVGVLSVEDGPTLAAFAQRTDPTLVTLGEFTIESEGHLSLRDVYSREYDSIGVHAGAVRVIVLGNDVSEPSEVTFIVESN